MRKGLLLGWMVIFLGAVAWADDFPGVKKLAGRLGGEELSSRVTFIAWPREATDKAEIIPTEKGFTIRATNARMASMALGVYLRDVAKGHISWCGNRLPTTWTMPTERLEIQPRYPYAMAYNYCTLSYTMAFWDAKAWQAEIDRLALSGYSQALMMAGVQKIWKLTLEDMGYTRQQGEDFICDDAVQAWWLMGNLQALGNGRVEGHYPVVSDAIIEKDAKLGAWLVKAMREVGIEPIFQGFVGLVPSTTTEAQFKAPARIFRNGNYCVGQKNPDVLDPTCAAFKDFSRAWNKNLKAVYGLNEPKKYPKFLGGDLFHESHPPASMTYDQKVNCAKFVQQYQQDAFPGVTWVVQSWQGSPDQTLRDGLDPRYTLIQYLDQTMSGTSSRANIAYQNRQTKAFLPWVWVEVLNFGGNTGMHGAFRRFRTIGELGEGNPNFRGYGLLSEGLETNPVSYDLYHATFAKRTKAEQNLDDRELAAWLEAYRIRRYGYTDSDLKAAHEILAATVWTCTRNQQGAVESVFCANPSYQVNCVSAWGPTTGTPYQRRDLVKAARHILAAAKRNPKLMKLSTFRYDFVEIFQQLLADRGREILPDCASDQAKRDEFRTLLNLLDDILSCSVDWRLDYKEARTVAKGGTAGTAAYRRMITTWTPGGLGQTQLSQYAHRSYAGLVRHNYAVKWNAFFDATEGKISSGDYRALCAKLDREFPTMKLPPTTKTVKPLALATEILRLVSADLRVTRTTPEQASIPDPESRFFVTKPGEISVNKPGKAYKSFPEALAAARALRKANPNKPVKLWILSQEVFEEAKAEVEAYNAAHKTTFTYYGDGNGIEIK